MVEMPLLLATTPLRVSRPRTPSPAALPDLLRGRTIEVTGFEARITSQLLTLFFKNKKKSGGGPIEDIQVDQQRGSARITFSSPKGLHFKSILL